MPIAQCFICLFLISITGFFAFFVYSPESFITSKKVVYLNQDKTALSEPDKPNIFVPKDASFEMETFEIFVYNVSLLIVSFFSVVFLIFDYFSQMYPNFNLLDF